MGKGLGDVRPSLVIKQHPTEAGKVGGNHDIVAVPDVDQDGQSIRAVRGHPSRSVQDSAEYDVSLPPSDLARR
jgi:hypothetical protein